MGTRRERVVLELQDNFSGPMGKPVFATKALDASLDKLDRQQVKTTRSAAALDASLGKLDRQQRLTVLAARSLSRDALPQMGRSADQAGASIDRLSGRLGLILRGLGAFGPAIAPIGASLAPVLAGLVAQLGAAALGAGAVVGAFHGVGDALDAVNKAQLEPTAENMAAAVEELDRLSEAAQDAVFAMDQFGGVLRSIRDTSAEGFFPGFIAGLSDLERMSPIVERIFGNVATAAGDLFAGGTESLASNEWYAFFSFLEDEAAPTLVTFGQTLGNFGKGFAELMMAMDPLTDDFTSGLLEMSRAFESWAEGISASNGFAEFVDYVRTTGPQVLSTFSSLADMLLQVAEAASPMGGPVLAGIEAFADAVAAIADSPLGPPIMAAVTAMSALSLVTRGYGAIAATSWMQAARGAQGYIAQMGAARGALAGLGKGVGILAGMTLATSDLGRSMGVTNTAMYGTMGLMAGPWGAAAGLVVGGFLDMAEASDTFSDAADRADQVLRDTQASMEEKAKAVEETRKQLEKMREDFETTRGPADGEFWLTAGLDDAKNSLEGLFGESDLEEAEKRFRGQEESLRASEQAAAGYALSLGFLSEAEMRHAQATEAANAELRERASLLLESMSAEASYEGTLNRLHEAVKEGGGAFQKNGQLVRGATDAQIRGAEALNNMAAAWAELTPAERRARGGIAAARAEFIRAATAMGMGKEAARGLAQELFNIPANTRADVEVKTAQALNGIRAVTTALARVNDKTVTLTTVHRTNGVSTVMGLGVTGRSFEALGGFYPAGARAYANGGMDHPNAHRPEIARGGTWRVWAEPETQGETYIPHANDHRRPMAKAYLEQTAEMFGGTVEWYARGGIDRRRLKQAFREFDISKGMDLGDVRSELNAFRIDFRAAGGEWSDRLKMMSRGLLSTSRSLDKHRQQLDAERDQLRELRQQRRDYAGQVAGNFRSNAFNQSDVFGNGGLAGTFSTLEADLSGAKEFQAALNRARGLGLSGEAFKQLTASGDIATAKDLDTRGEIRRLQQLLAQRTRVTATLGNTSADRVFGQAIDRQVAELQNLRATVTQLKRELVKSGARVENGAARGTRAGMADRTRAQASAGRI